MMDIDARHSFLREKLNSLGFTQPLPFGSLAIVSALLDDLILTTKNLKDAKRTVSELEKVTSTQYCVHTQTRNINTIIISVHFCLHLMFHLIGENCMAFGRGTIQM